MKKLVYFFLPIFFLFGAIMAGCTKDDVNPDSEWPDDPGVSVSDYKVQYGSLTVYREKATDFVEGYEDNSVIYLNAGMPEALQPRTGETIVVAPGENLPLGFAGTVKRITKDERIAVETEEVTLSEMFETLDLNITEKDIDALVELSDAEGRPVEPVWSDAPNGVAQTKTPTRGSAGWSVSGKYLVLPICISEEENGKSIDVKGAVYAGIKKLDIHVGNEGHKIKDIRLDATMSLGMQLTTEAKATGQIDLLDRPIGKMTFRASVVIPPGIPIVIPITFNLYLRSYVAGEVTAEVSLSPEFSSTWNVNYSQGAWTCNKSETQSNSEWISSQFEVEGKLGAGLKAGFLLGFYSSKIGIGINFTPTYEIGCKWSVTDDRIWSLNPDVTQRGFVGSEAYCIANFFEKGLAKKSFEFPEYEFWSRADPLLPVVSNFKINVEGSKAKMEWNEERKCFMEMMGLQSGITIFGKDGKTVIETIPKKSIAAGRFTAETSSLKGGTYYAANSVAVNGLDYKIYGSKHRFEICDITGTWKCVYRSTNPNALLQTMILREDNTMTQTYWFKDPGEYRTYHCPYTYRNNCLRMDKSNGDVQYWNVIKLDESNLWLEAQNDGFIYRFIRSS